MLIFAGMVFAAKLDGSARLLGCLPPVLRGVREVIVLIVALAFILAVFYMPGIQIAAQWTQFQYN